MKQLSGAVIGSGYFSQFHYDAWARIPEIRLLGLSTLDEAKGAELSRQYNIPCFEDYREMLEKLRPDFVDIITPPATHAEMARFAASLGIQVICQKPVTPLVADSLALIEEISDQVRFIIHENFRFQPWHRKIKKFIEEDLLGELQNLHFRSRMGDGWGPEAYLGRQPYFRDYPQLLIYETGIHFIDVFRYHAGKNPERVFAHLKQLNPVIQGEDCGLMLLDFGGNTTAVWDADRYHEEDYIRSRYTFGFYVLEGEKGSLRLYSDGSLSWQGLGEPEKGIPHRPSREGFAGDSVYAFQRHAIESLISGQSAETEAKFYGENLKVQEAVYRSAEGAGWVKP